MKKQLGFTLVEGLLVILVLAVVGFGGYYVWHSNHKTKLVAAPNTSTTTKSATKTATTSPSASQKYLAISQLGIKIPLTRAVNDLNYIWYPTGGYLSYPIAVLGSTKLAEDAVKANPTHCSLSSFTSTNGLYPISSIYSKYWYAGGSGGPTEVKKITVNSKNYYWYTLGSGGNECVVSLPISFSSNLETYYNSALNSFSSSVSN